MGALSPMHLAVVAIIALLVFGPKKLPELAKGIGEAMKEFKKSMHSVDEPEPPSHSVATSPVPLPEVTGTVSTGDIAHPPTPPQT